ncbi:MAG: DUF5723 family protein [Prevotellaceae bacterium]|jgi:hypothetical protein|nr:DUF5723 family protein [Prevotellaceae bacterium]
MITKKILLGFLILGICRTVSAQQNMTLYQMHDILQSNSLNPAVASNCRLNIGFPLLSSISLAAGTPFSYNNLINSGVSLSDQKSDIAKMTETDKALDGQQMLSLMKNSNIISANGNVALIMVGYRMERAYIQFNINERFSTAVSFNKDPVDLFVSGNSKFAGQTVDGKMAVSGLHYREYALGAAFLMGETTWFGVRGRLLFGRLSVAGNNSFSVYTDPVTYNMTVNTEINTHASIPGEVKYLPSSNAVNGFNSQLKGSHFIFNQSNLGGALDFGITTSSEDGLEFSASILNLGMVSWSKNTHLFSLKNSKTYSGYANGARTWKALKDTLISVFRPNHAYSEPYSQWLSPTLMAGGNYPINDYMKIGLTGYGEFNSAGVPWALSAILQTRDIPYVHGALSYTVTNNSFVNIGLGLGFEIGPFNIHAITDNIISLFDPFPYKYATLQFGINFKFGCSDSDSGGYGESKKFRSVPCPSHGGGGLRKFKSVPCSVKW